MSEYHLNEETSVSRSHSHRTFSRNKVLPSNSENISKYTAIWQRARIKLRAKFMLTKLLSKTNSIHNIVNISSTETTIFEDLPFGMFHPDQPFKGYWNLFITFTLLYTAIVLPFSMAFYESDAIGIWDYLDLAVDIIYFFDLCINFSSAFYDSEGKLVRNRLKIIINYLKSWFIIDLISCIPFSLLSLVTSNQSHKNNKFLVFLRLPRLYKLFRLSRIIKLFNSSTTSDFFVRIQDFLSIKNSATRFCTSVATILISLHIISCMWYFSAKLDNFSPETWVVRLNYQDADVSTLYITSIYWAFATLATVGYGDIFGYTINEKVICILWMICGLYFFGFTIGSLSSMMANIDTKEKILNNKLAAMDEFGSDANLSKSLLFKLKHALRFSTEITGFSWVDKQNIFYELPKNLQYEVAIAMHHGAARKISFFDRKDSVVVSSILPFLTPVYVNSKEFVYETGDFADEIYFVIKGHVNYIHNKETVVGTIYACDYFGDIEVVFQIPRKYSAKAVRSLEMLAMNRKRVFRLKNDYACIWEELRQDAVAKDKEFFAYISRMNNIKKTVLKKKSLLLPITKKNNFRMNDIGEKVNYLFEVAKTLEEKLEKLQYLAKLPKKTNTRSKSI